MAGVPRRRALHRLFCIERGNRGTLKRFFAPARQKRKGGKKGKGEGSTGNDAEAKGEYWRPTFALDKKSRSSNLKRKKRKKGKKKIGPAGPP